jgi:MFS family permease
MGRRVPNYFNLAVIIFVALGSTACSYSLAVTGGTIGQPTFYTALNLVPPGEPGYGATANWISAFNGTNAGAAVIGALFSSWFANWAGRKRSIQLGCMIAIIGGAVTAGSVSAAMFVTGRLISGLAIGILVTGKRVNLLIAQPTKRDKSSRCISQNWRRPRRVAS